MTEVEGPGTRREARRWWVLALLCVVNFMVILDSQIVIVALPSIESDLGFTAAGAQWVMSGYLLSFGGLLLLGGRAGDLLGRRRVLLAGITVFGLASLLCGLAWTPEVLIAARVVHGASAAMMAPTALAIVMTTFPDGAERNKALASWGSLGGTGATAALLMGGFLVGGLGWEWIFFINVPVALCLLALSPVLLTESTTLGGERAYDPAGAATLTGGLALLTLAVVEAPDAGWLSGRTLGVLAVSAVLLVAFVMVESRSSAPLIPLRIFGSRNLVGGNAVMLLAGMSAWGLSLGATWYAQVVLGFTPLRYGVGTVVMTATTIVGSFAAQAAVTRIGFRPVAAAAMVLMGAGCLLLTTISTDGTYFGDLFAGLLIFGPGLGAATVAAAIAALANVHERDAGVASGTSTAAFQLGGALGAAIVTTVVVTHTAGSTPEALTTGLRAGFVASTAFGALGLLLTLALLRRAGAFNPRREQRRDLMAPNKPGAPSGK